MKLYSIFFDSCQFFSIPSIIDINLLNFEITEPANAIKLTLTQEYVKTDLVRVDSRYIITTTNNSPTKVSSSSYLLRIGFFGIEYYSLPARPLYPLYTFPLGASAEETVLAP